jgi:hypothetical protein
MVPPAFQKVRVTESLRDAFAERERTGIERRSDRSEWIHSIDVVSKSETNTRRHRLDVVVDVAVDESPLNTALETFGAPVKSLFTNNLALLLLFQNELSTSKFARKAENECSNMVFALGGILVRAEKASLGKAMCPDGQKTLTEPPHDNNNKKDIRTLE